MNSLALIIPSVGRPDSLRRTLASVDRTLSGVEECIVVARTDDSTTHRVADAFGVRLVTVDKAGLAWAMRVGALSTDCDVVAFTDDDAEIPPDWPARLLRHYDDPKVGAVGGRDNIHGPVGQLKCPRQTRIGTIDLYGRVVGAHHLATGPARSVDHLKGVNSSFRRSLFTQLEFQSLLNGSGAQSRNEFVASRGIAALGYRLIMDPSLVVDHYPGERAAGDDRGRALAKIYESSFNERLAFRLYSRKRSLRNLIFTSCIGYGHAPGAVRVLFGASIPEVRSTIRGIVDSFRVARKPLWSKLTRR